MFHDMVHDYNYGFTVIDIETGDEVDPMTIIAPTAVKLITMLNNLSRNYKVIISCFYLT